MLVETSAGAGVGSGSPPKMPHANTTERASAQTAGFQGVLNAPPMIWFLMPVSASIGINWCWMICSSLIFWHIWLS